MHICVCVELMGTHSGVTPQVPFSFYFLELGPSTFWNSPSRLEWLVGILSHPVSAFSALASQVPGTSVPKLFSHRPWGLEPSPHATLPLHSLPRLYFQDLLKLIRAMEEGFLFLSLPFRWNALLLWCRHQMATQLPTSYRPELCIFWCFKSTWRQLSTVGVLLAREGVAWSGGWKHRGYLGMLVFWFYLVTILLK